MNAKNVCDQCNLNFKHNIINTKSHCAFCLKKICEKIILKMQNIHQKQTNKQQYDQKVRVALRYRPPKPKSKNKLIEEYATYKDATNIIGKRNIFTHPCKTQDIFESMCHDFTNNLFTGVCCAIMAYGQTGSGKTYTMYGDLKKNGIIPLIGQKIFEKKSQYSQKWNINVSMSFFEIYNEQINDLLNLNQKNMKVRYDKSMDEFFVVNLSNLHVNGGVNSLLKLITNGLKNRKVSKTKYNNNSSRSHTILRIMLKCQNKYLGISRSSYVDLVDLAGSENTSKAGSSKQHETKSINQSLLSLKNIVRELASQSTRRKSKKKKHGRSKSLHHNVASYRNSKLTELLKNSISGKAKVSIICTLSPDIVDTYENKSTIMFAKNAKTVDVTPTANQQIIKTLESTTNQTEKLQEEIKRYEHEIESLKKQLDDNRSCNKHIPSLNNNNNNNDLFYKLQMIDLTRKMLLNN